MTPEQQRIAIAEKCGWTTTHKGLWVESLQTYAALPNYLNDLNAMHEAWLFMSYNQQAKFGHYLSVEVFGKGLADGMLFGEHDLSRLASATAAQRAEAFLRTLNLWTS